MLSVCEVAKACWDGMEEGVSLLSRINRFWVKSRLCSGWPASRVQDEENGQNGFPLTCGQPCRHKEVFKRGYLLLLQVLSPEERKGPHTHLLGTRRADPFSVRGTL